MTLDLLKEKKAAEAYLKTVGTKPKNTPGVDIGVNKEVSVSQAKSSPAAQTTLTLSQKAKLAAYLKSIGQQ